LQTERSLYSCGNPERRRTTSGIRLHKPETVILTSFYIILYRFQTNSHYFCSKTT